MRFPREFAKVNDFVAYTKEKYPLNCTDLMEICLDVDKDLKSGTLSQKGVYEERQLNKCSRPPIQIILSAMSFLAIVIVLPIMTPQWHTGNTLVVLT